MIDYTAQEYISTFSPRLADIFPDPQEAYAEMTQEAERLAIQLEIGVSSEGKYRRGIWDLVG